MGQLAHSPCRLLWGLLYSSTPASRLTVPQLLQEAAISTLKKNKLYWEVKWCFFRTHRNTEGLVEIRAHKQQLRLDAPEGSRNFGLHPAVNAKANARQERSKRLY